MEYEELLNILSENKNFSICESRYSPQHFGNFNIDFLYKSKIKMQILNDRGIIEIFLIYRLTFFATAVPLGFAIDFLKNSANKNNSYSFQASPMHTPFWQTVQCILRQLQRMIY